MQISFKVNPENPSEIVAIVPPGISMETLYKSNVVMPFVINYGPAPPLKQPVKQSVKQPVTQPVKQSITQPVTQPVTQPTNKRINNKKKRRKATLKENKIPINPFINCRIE